MLDPQLLDAVDHEFASAARAAVASCAACSRPAFDAAASYPELITALYAAGLWENELAGSLDITPPYAPFSVLTPNERFLLPAALLDLLRSDSLHAALEPFLGPEITASGNQHSRVKLPNTREPGYGMDATTTWHQDAIVQWPESDQTDVITCWIPMTDADEQHGCLVFAPGFHHDEQLLADPPPPEMVSALDVRAVAVPARRGDIVLLHKRTPHASAPNLGERTRWSLDLRFFPTGQPSDRPWYPSIPVASKDPSRVLRDAGQWRQLWDRAIANVVSTGQPLPGRPAFARLFAARLLEQWRRGEVPRIHGWS